MHIYANTRKDSTKFYLGKQDYGFIYGEEQTGKVFFSNGQQEFKKKHKEVEITHSLIIQKVKAPKVLEALPFMLTKRSMSDVFELAEDM